MTQEMTKKEARIKVTEMLSAGEMKQDVFDELSGRGVKDRILAYLIAAYPDPRRVMENNVHRRVVIGIAYFNLLLAVIATLFVVVKVSLGSGVLVGVFALSISGLFVWGFTKNKARVYTAFLVMSFTQFPRQFSGFAAHPGASALGLVIGVAIVAYVWFVQQRLFPDLAFVSARKVGGQYLFTD